MDADDPRSRRQALVSAIVEARRTDEPVVFSSADARVRYADRTLRLEVDADERERLDELLAAYHVFKVEQPATRKADDGVVYLSAVTDPKHAADFLEGLFREVYGAPEDYELQISE
ncbi:hypothetical protein HWV07_18595 [Natronomonas salina]|uniref:hypothetical protein n=1 Tax=Natronomonas salina TaxID=1710540 RepID=UPI0015B44AE3|nr:hypothetical protein [Natronomonas salina]QLD90947.1 hypothetical protein HWV07_18595 [Natronomonas salina]